MNTKKIVAFLIRSIVSKIEKKTSQNFPKIIVTGTIGKSSLTLMLIELFKNNGYSVISGTSKDKNLNTIEGLGLVLMRFIYSNNKNADNQNAKRHYNLEIEDKKGLVKTLYKLRYLVQLIKYAFFVEIKFLKTKPILVYEVGFDYQNEGQNFVDIFKEVDFSIITSLTHEHSQNFTDSFDQNRLGKIVSKVNVDLINQLKDKSHTNRLKNIAIEQFVFAPKAKLVIYPTKLDSLNNFFYVNEKQYSALAIRDSFYTLAEGYLNFYFHQDYFLPDSFAKNAQIIDIIAKNYGFKRESVKDIIASSNIFPNSRFSKFKGINNSNIVDSSYNSDPASLSTFLQTIKSFSASFNINDKSIISLPKNLLILGEMRELGAISVFEHEKIIQEIIQLQDNPKIIIQDTYLIGKEWLKINQNNIQINQGNISYIRYGNKHFKVFEKAGDINRYIEKMNILPEFWFWVKGSQNTIFLEIVVEYLLLNKEDKNKLCRQGEDWAKTKLIYN
jgi:hypothetical protein